MTYHEIPLHVQLRMAELLRLEWHMLIERQAEYLRRDDLLMTLRLNQEFLSVSRRLEAVLAQARQQEQKHANVA